MATYSTDLTTLTTAESGTLTEFTDLASGGAPGQSGEQFIQGTDCFSQNTGNKGIGLTISLVYDYGSGYSYAAGEVCFAWLFYFAGTNLETYANSGWRFGIGSSTSAYDWFRVGGSDYGAHKYGGWFNFAIDPTATESGTSGGGNGGTYRYYGNIPYTLNAVTKGDPVAVDAIRAGRGEISITGSGGSFSELASYNDYNAGGTPPGTSSTSVDSGRHVLGLFQAAGGSYLWKGLMSLGLTGTSVTFSDSNETIVIDDCPHTYASFNKVEINNASSSVTFNNVTFISTATTANGLGYFEVVDNATVNLIGCSFNEMGIFGFLSNTTLTGCAFNGCGAIDVAGATVNGCGFNVSTSPLVADGTEINSVGSTSPNDFVGDGTATPGHAVNLGSVTGGGSAGSPVTLNWYNVLDDGSSNTYWGGSTQASTGGTQGDANDAILINVAAGTYVKIAVASGATIPSVQNTGTGFLEITANEVTLTITVKDITTGSVIEGAMVYVTNVAETATYINKVETNASGQVSHTTSLGSAQPLAGRVRAATPATKAYTKYYQTAPVAGTFSNTANTDITIQLIPDE